MTANNRVTKCDERLPRCSLCAKKEEDCTYTDLSNRLNASPKSQSNHECRNAVVLDGDTSRSNSTRMLEIRLFHHFITDAASTIALNEVDLQFVTTLAPRLSVSNPYLLDSILAWSALHLAYCYPASHRYYLHIALDYQNSSVSEFNKVLASPMPLDNCKPALFCSIFTTMFTAAYPGVSREWDVHAIEPLSEVFQLRSLVTGCMFLIYQSVENDPTGEMKLFLDSVISPVNHLDQAHRERMMA